jgi:GT2 family glycosyltransferase
LKEKQIFFSKEFPFAAYEDIEWGYRLMQAGALFRYVPEALGFHHHPVTFESYKKRMVLAGRSYAHLQRLHPDLAKALSSKPKNAMTFFKHAFKGKTREFILNRPRFHKTLKTIGIGKSEEKWVKSILGYYQELGYRQQMHE